VIPAQVVFEKEPVPAEGLRSRKKARTRRAIEDAAFALFAEQGYDATTIEQIVEGAEVSETTFFRYFPSKADLILEDHGSRLPALLQALVERPSTENDLVAVRVALQQAWVAAIDPARTARTAQAIASSNVLRGMTYNRGLGWYADISAALARRRGLDMPDQQCSLVAWMALSVFGGTLEEWIANGCVGDLGEAVERGFTLMVRLCSE
jgi:AcrR family transcriptional regulator